jgi:hypothetical protein
MGLGQADSSLGGQNLQNLRIFSENLKKSRLTQETIFLENYLKFLVQGSGATCGNLKSVFANFNF